MRACVRAVVPTVVLLLIATAATAGAQSLWMDREARTSVRVEMRIPSYPDDYGFAEKSARYATFVTARVPVRPAAWIVVEAAYARDVESGYDIDGNSYAARVASVGNPYLVLEFAKQITGLHYEIGFQSPLARRSQSGALFTGFTSEVESQQAFLDHTFSARVGALYHRAAHARSPVGYDARLGATWQVPTAHPRSPYRDPDADPFNFEDPSKPLAERHALYVEHAADVRLEGAHAYLGVGWIGRWLANNDAGDFGSNSVEELSVALEILRGPIHPGVTIVAPLDADLKSGFDGVLGLSLSVGAGRHDRWWLDR